MSNQQAGITKEYRRSFRLDEGSLRKIAEILRTHLAKLKEKNQEDKHAIVFTVYSLEDSFYETASIEAVLSDDNSKSRRIQRLVIRIASPLANSLDPKDDRSICMIDFDQDDPCPARFQILYQDRDWCYLLAQDLHAQMDRVTEGRLESIMSRRSTAVGLGLLISAGVGVIGYRMHGTIWPPPETINLPTSEVFGTKDLYYALSSDIRAVYYTLGSVVILLLLGIFSPTSLVRKALCGSVFYWRDQIPANDRLENLRRNIFWGVLVAAIVGYVINRITSK